MSERFENLKKIPAHPAVRFLSYANLKLQTKTEAGAGAPVSDVLAELSEKGAIFDMITLLAASIPRREATWWACLAARDLVGPDKSPVPPPLAAAEAWVFKPTEENREAVRLALENADMDDETAYCALAALYAEGNMGPGQLAEHPAPPGAVPGAVIAMNMKALEVHADDLETYGNMLVDRAVDIARGGSGRVKPAEAEDS